MKKAAFILIMAAVLAGCGKEEFSQFYYWESEKITVEQKYINKYENIYSVPVRIDIKASPAVPAYESPYSIEWKVVRYRNKTDSLLFYGTIYSNDYNSNDNYTLTDNVASLKVFGIACNVTTHDKLYLKCSTTFKNKIDIPAKLQITGSVVFEILPTPQVSTQILPFRSLRR